MAELDVQVVEGGADHGQSAGPVVVLLHGFSMRADDLAPFGASMAASSGKSVESNAVFVFPNGPIDLAPHGLPGHAWWLIDVARRDAEMSRGARRDLSDESPTGLPAARTSLLKLVAEVSRTWPERPLFLGGFSQGAILSLDVIVRTPLRPAGVILLSGARVEAESLAPLLHRTGGLPIFQSHGEHDRDLSFDAASALSNDLVTAGALVSWWPFPGGHEIPLPVLRELKKFIRRHTHSAADAGR